MVYKTVCVVCLVLSLLARVDDVSSRPTGLHGSVKTAVPQSLQRKDQVSRPGPVPLGSQRVLSADFLQKENEGLKEFVSKMIQHFKLHAPPAAVFTFPVTFIAITLLCCVTCTIDRSTPLQQSF
ncbi:hypothetical protein Q7C36_017864 [Tachysurus vachellii]|uniref:Uncharacterized protein n=1 Tax=Tachysurus vachellii TaxID=175792 RepID=A0AA88M139_TACVA|nr:hypothetical protein Q7C36_017864 [Tachysurus vachellii]